MRLDESICEHQTMSLFGDMPKNASQPVKVSGEVEIYFDGGCLSNPGQKYGSFQIKLDGKEILNRSWVDFGFGTNNEAEFNALKLALDEAVGWFRKQAIELKLLSMAIESDLTIVRNRLVVKNVIFKKYPSSQRMFALANECLGIMNQFGKFVVIWKGRANNVERFGHVRFLLGYLLRSNPG